MMGYCCIRDNRRGYTGPPNFAFSSPNTIVITFTNGTERKFVKKLWGKDWKSYTVSDNKDWFTEANKILVIEYSEGYSFFGRTILVVPMSNIQSISKQ